MGKSEFLASLREKLINVPEHEIRKSIAFYREMIDDQIENGASEEEAVQSLGELDEIVRQIKSELPMKTLLEEKVNNKRFDTWVMLLLILGFPVWFPLLVSLLCIILTLYLCIWIFDIALWSVVAAFGAMFVGGVAAAAATAFYGMPGEALFYFGSALAGAGFCIFSFFGMLYLTKGIFKMTVLLTKKLKMMMIGKGRGE